MRAQGIPDQYLKYAADPAGSIAKLAGIELPPAVRPMIAC